MEVFQYDPQHRRDVEGWNIICFDGEDKIYRYGFDDDVYKSLAEMSRLYHLSEGRAKKTEKEAIVRLKKEMGISLHQSQISSLL